MRRFLATAGLTAAILAGIAGTALAQARPDSLTMSCAQVRDYMRARGAAVVGTGRYIYDRFVIGQQFCAVTEGIRPAWVKARDTPQCPIGYTCVPLRDSWPYDDF